MLSKWKPKYSTKNLSVTLQTKIDQLVNGVHEYQKDPPNLIYLMYLSPLNSSFKQTSRNLVFISYPNPAILPNCICHLMASSNASHRHQNFSQHSEYVRQVFGLRTSQGCVDGEKSNGNSREMM